MRKYWAGSNQLGSWSLLFLIALWLSRQLVEHIGDWKSEAMLADCTLDNCIVNMILREKLLIGD